VVDPLAVARAASGYQRPNRKIWQVLHLGKRQRTSSEPHDAGPDNEIAAGSNESFCFYFIFMFLFFNVVAGAEEEEDGEEDDMKAARMRMWT
jgi:hypothetical protein